MITEKIVKDLVADYLESEGCEVVVRRSNCGWPTECGWQISIISDIPGDRHTLYLNDNNTEHSAWSKMTTFAVHALNPA